MDEREPPLETGVARRVRDASPRGVDLVARLARAGIESKLFGQPTRSIRVGRYEVLDELGTGGMGVVYLARDPELDREVALKLLRPASVTQHDPETARTRLVREARAMARLSHPNVLTVHEVGTFEDQVFVAMEYVEGRTLAEWLAQAERPWREVLEAFDAAGRGLAAAHDKGIVHRDFKPENVMVSDDGRVLVLDFGLARSAEADAAPEEPPRPLPTDALDASLTLTGALVGTPAYMSPELYMGKPADARSDQFAFCVALWDAVYRQRPFVGNSLAALAHAVMSGDIAEPIGVGPRPAWLRRVLERGLAVDPEARHPSMEALLDEIAQRMQPRWHQRWMPAVVGGAALVLGIGLMATATRTPASPPVLEVTPGVSAAAPAGVKAAMPARAEIDAVAAAADHASAAEPESPPKLDAAVATGGADLGTTTAASPALEIEAAEPPPSRPQVRRQPARRPSWPHAWCYLREGALTKLRAPSGRLESQVKIDGECWSCDEYRDPDGMRLRVNQHDCQHYAVCHASDCG